MTNKWKHIKGQETKIRRKLRSCPYTDELINSFVRYGRALDNLDFETVFLKLWSLLEFLTCSAEKYDLLIRRVSFLYAENNLVRQFLQHLRVRRNSFVHSAMETDQAVSLVFQLKDFVERVLLFHVRNSGRFESREDAARYLDLPYDPKVIRHEIRRYKMALVFQAPKRGRSTVRRSGTSSMNEDENRDSGE